MKWAISWPRGWRGKGCENRQAFRLPRASLRSACQVRKHFPASGARTGRALQNGCALSHRRSDCLAICCWPVAQAARLWQSVKPRAGRPLESQCSAHAGRSAVLQCAPRARTTGKPMLRAWLGASQKMRLPSHWPVLPRVAKMAASQSIASRQPGARVPRAR